VSAPHKTWANSKSHKLKTPQIKNRNQEFSSNQALTLADTKRSCKGRQPLSNTNIRKP